MLSCSDCTVQAREEDGEGERAGGRVQLGELALRCPLGQAGQWEAPKLLPPQLSMRSQQRSHCWVQEYSPGDSLHNTHLGGLWAH